MRFVVPPDLFAALRAKPVYPLGAVDPVSRDHNAVWLHTDMGPSWWLTSDGRVLMDDVLLGTPLHEASDEDAIAGIAVGAKTRAEPRLLELLPQRPVGIPNCQRCQGRGWCPFASSESFAGDPTHLVLCSCGGLGWLRPRLPPG